jgi:HAD superfamily hydrolase (TIGR01509 family)
VSHGIELVCFDLGRVLIRLCASWERACELAGVAPPQGLANLGAEARAALEKLSARYDTGPIDLTTFARVCVPYSGSRPDDLVKMFHCYLLGPYPGAAALLEELSRTGVRTACLSNTGEPHWGMMNDPAGSNYLALERLHYRFPSHLVGLRKPDDAIYAHVERETGLSGKQIVFFDDVEENVQAAARRGWRACRIDPKPDDPIPQVRRYLKEQGLF